MRLLGFDDAPFHRAWRGDVPVVGILCQGGHVEGVLRGAVRRDGADATRRLAALVTGSRFAGQAQAVLLQGIALAGFNVVDLHGLHAALGCPVLAVARSAPDLPAIRHALLERVPGGRKKWALIERAGPMEPCGEVWVQRAGIDLAGARALLTAGTVQGRLPEALRIAHLVAGALARGESRGRA
ncbi:MAG: DUF99 family protein [Pseudomonadota bacterium]